MNPCSTSCSYSFWKVRGLAPFTDMTRADLGLLLPIRAQLSGQWPQNLQPQQAKEPSKILQLSFGDGQ